MPPKVTVVLENGWWRRRMTRKRAQHQKRGKGKSFKMPKKSLIQNRTWYVFPRPSEVPEETVGEADLEVRPGTIPHGYEVNFKWLYKLDANISRFDKRKERVVSATLSTCSLDLLGIFCCLLLCSCFFEILFQCFWPVYSFDYFIVLFGSLSSKPDSVFPGILQRIEMAVCIIMRKMATSLAGAFRTWAFPFKWEKF